MAICRGDGAFDAVARFPGTCAAVSRPSPLEFSCDDAEAVRAHVDDIYVIAIGKQVPPNAQGECVGLYSITGESFGEAQLDLFLEQARLSKTTTKMPSTRHWWTTTD